MVVTTLTDSNDPGTTVPDPNSTTDHVNHLVYYDTTSPHLLASNIQDHHPEAVSNNNEESTPRPNFEGSHRDSKPSESSVEVSPVDKLLEPEKKESSDDVMPNQKMEETSPDKDVKQLSNLKAPQCGLFQLDVERDSPCCCDDLGPIYSEIESD